MRLPWSFDERRPEWKPQVAGPDLGEVGELSELIDRGIRAGGAQPAVTDSEGSLSYQELDRAASTLGTHLLTAGVRPGEPVVIHCRLSRWAVVAMLGVLRAGAQYVPVDTAFPAERRAAMIRESGARLVVLEPQPSAELPPGCAFEAVLRIPGHSSQWPVQPGRFPDTGPNRPAYTLFTSGSSGAPKGVAVSRRGLAYSTQARLAHYRSSPSVFLLCSSISFDSSAGGIYWALASSAHLVIPSPVVVDTVAILAACERHRASHVLLIPSLYRILLDSDQNNRLSSLRTVIVAGETCPPDLVRRHFRLLPDTALYNEYGPTECTVWALAHRCQPADGDAATVPIGRPIPGAVAYLRTDDAPAAADQVGELWLSGPGVALGYSSASGSPAAGTRPDDRVYRTGDFARMDSDGLVHYIGRRDGQLKLAGARVERQEIEHALSAAIGGRGSAVGVIRQDGTPIALVGFVVAAPEELHLATLRRRMRGTLPYAAIPETFQAVDTLPVLSNGKLDRQALDRMAASLLEARFSASADQGVVK